MYTFSIMLAKKSMRSKEPAVCFFLARFPRIFKNHFPYLFNTFSILNLRSSTPLLLFIFRNSWSWNSILHIAQHCINNEVLCLQWNSARIFEISFPFRIPYFCQYLMHILAKFNTFSRSWKPILKFNTFSILSIPRGNPVLVKYLTEHRIYKCLRAIQNKHFWVYLFDSWYAV